MRRSLKGLVGLALLLFLGGASVTYPWWSTRWLVECPFGPDPALPAQTVCDGTLGGLWRSMLVGLLAGAGSCLVALVLAVLGRRAGRVVDGLVARGAELFFAVPDVLVLVAVGFAVNVVNGEGAARVSPLVAMTLALVAVGWAAPTRQLQRRLETLAGMDFVLAARSLGASRTRVVLRHLLPFAADFVWALFLLRVPAVVLAESTVSFLGFGLPASEPSLGAYLGTHYGHLLHEGQAMVVVPAWVLLAVVVLAFQWAGQDLLGRADREAGARR